MPLEVHYQRHGTVKSIVDSRIKQEPEFREPSSDEDEEEFFLIIASDEEEEDCTGDKQKPKLNNLCSIDVDPRLGTLVNKICDNELLTVQQKEQLIELVKDYVECFGVDYSHLSQTNLVEFHVDTGDAKPIYRRPYPNMSFADKEFLKKDLEEMVANGVLTPTMHSPKNASRSGWSFPWRYIKKKTGDRRLVTQFQDLNKVTVRDPWPLPNLQDIIESFGDSKVLSAVDCLKGFHQIKVDEESIPKLTITTLYGCFSYRVLPFGVLNGPSCFSRVVHLLIEPLSEFAVAYLDDITLHSKSFGDHFENLEKFLKRLVETNMRLNANKCTLFTDKVELLVLK